MYNTCFHRRPIGPVIYSGLKLFYFAILMEEESSEQRLRNKNQHRLWRIIREDSLHLPSSLAIVEESSIELEQHMHPMSVLTTGTAWAPSRREQLAKLASPLSTTKKQVVSVPPPTEDRKPDVQALERTLLAPQQEQLTGALATGASSDQWHEIGEREFTAEETRDLRIIENRQHIDPKRFYKSTGTGRKQGELPTRVHFGTVVVGAHEFYSSRLTKRERRSRIIDEVLGDERLAQYARKRSMRIQVSKNTGKRIVDPASKKKRRRSKF